MWNSTLLAIAVLISQFLTVGLSAQEEGIPPYLGSRNVTLVSFIPSDVRCLAIYVHDGTLFHSDNEVFMLSDISDPSNPIELSRTTIPKPEGDVSTINDIFVRENYAYIAGNQGVMIYNIQYSHIPEDIGQYNHGDIIGLGVSGMLGVYVKDNYLYVADGDDGLEIADISNPANPVKIQYNNYEHFQSGIGEEVFVNNNQAFITGLYRTLLIIDVTDPPLSFEVGQYHTQKTKGRGFFLSENKVYISTADSGLRVVDVADPVNPVEIASYISGKSYRDVEVRNNFAYLTHDTGLEILNVQDPENILEEGCYNTDPKCLKIAVSGDYTYVANFEGVYIFRNDFLYLSITSDYYEFGETLINTSEEWNTFSLKNMHNEIIILDSINVDNPVFSYTFPQLPVSINPGDSINISIQFNPVSVDSFTAVMKIYTDNPNIPEKDIFLNGSAVQPTSAPDNNSTPRQFKLYQNYPNPFNPVTKIRYTLKNATDVRITIYSILGQEIITLVNDNRPAGWHEAVWDGRNYAGAQVGSGLYIYRMTAGNVVMTKKMVLVK
jgi:hypothetical protein